MSDCPDSAELQGFVLGEISEGERIRIESHLANCDECREVISLLAPPQEGVEATSPAHVLPSRELSPGQVVDGKYAIETLIGAGGMGVVARAKHRVLGTHVVVKLLSAPRVDSDTLRRFLREARAGAAIDSEHVVRVLDAGMLDSGRPYLVLEHLEGRDLADELAARGQVPAEEAVHYVMQACEALAVAHARGIVHRDIKPANLFLTQSSDGSALVKVLDFGIAKAAEESGISTRDTALTDTGAIMGSPRYMSPEQLQHTAGVDARTDVWSLGVVLYELISGKPPFDAPNVASLATAILTREPPVLESFAPDVPVGVANVISLCLAKDRDSRLQSVSALVRALAPFAPAEAATLVDRIDRIAMGRSPSIPSRKSRPSFGSGPLEASVGAVSWAPKSGPRSNALVVLAALIVAAAVAFFVWPSAERTNELRTGVALRAALASRAVRITSAPEPTVAPTVTRPEPSRADKRMGVRPPPLTSAAPAPAPRASSDIQRDGLLDRK